MLLKLINSREPTGATLCDDKVARLMGKKGQKKEEEAKKEAEALVANNSTGNSTGQSHTLTWVVRPMFCMVLII